MLFTIIHELVLLLIVLLILILVIKNDLIILKYIIINISINITVSRIKVLINNKH